jgi:hypothetical protein
LKPRQSATTRRVRADQNTARWVDPGTRIRKQAQTPQCVAQAN